MREVRSAHWEKENQGGKLKEGRVLRAKEEKDSGEGATTAVKSVILLRIAQAPLFVRTAAEKVTKRRSA